jgi:hypothetical protein
LIERTAKDLVEVTWTKAIAQLNLAA